MADESTDRSAIKLQSDPTATRTVEPSIVSYRRADLNEPPAFWRRWYFPLLCLVTATASVLATGFDLTGVQSDVVLRLAALLLITFAMLVAFAGVAAALLNEPYAGDTRTRQAIGCLVAPLNLILALILLVVALLLAGTLF